VDADLFVLTDQAPSLAPAYWLAPGMKLRHYGPASSSLLADLRSDKGMGWVPSTMWFTALTLHTPALALHYDLSIDGGGPIAPALPVPGDPRWVWLVIGALAIPSAGLAWKLWRPSGPSMRMAT
jgi:hypothetical protein